MDVLLSQLLGVGGGAVQPGAANSATLSQDNTGQAPQDMFAGLLALLGTQVAGNTEQNGQNAGVNPLQGTTVLTNSTATILPITGEGINLENKDIQVTDNTTTSLMAALYAVNPQIIVQAPNMVGEAVDQGVMVPHVELPVTTIQDTNTLLVGENVPQMDVPLELDFAAQETLPADVYAHIMSQLPTVTSDNTNLEASSALTSAKQPVLQTVVSTPASLPYNQPLQTTPVLEGEVTVSEGNTTAVTSNPEAMTKALQALQKTNEVMPQAAALSAMKLANTIQGNTVDKNSQSVEQTLVSNGTNSAGNNANVLSAAKVQTISAESQMEYNGEGNNSQEDSQAGLPLSLGNDNKHLPPVKGHEFGHHLHTSTLMEDTKPALQGDANLMPIDQVKVHVVKAIQDGEKYIKVELHPASLGRIDVHMGINAEGKTNIVIMADRPETLDLLKKDANQLERSLSDSGISTDTAGLNFGLRNGSEGQQQQRKHAYEQLAKIQGTLFATSTEQEHQVVQSYTGYVRQDRLDMKV